LPTSAGLRNDCVPNADQPFLNEAYCNNLTDNRVSGSSAVNFDDHRQRWTVKGQATLYSGRFWGMSHQFKMGLTIENERYFRALTIRPQITYQLIEFTDDSSDGQDEGLVSFGRINSVLSVPQTDDVRATGTNWGVYIEDQFKPRQNVTVTLGMRVDREETNSEGRSPFTYTAADIRQLEKDATALGAGMVKIPDSVLSDPDCRSSGGLWLGPCVELAAWVALQDLVPADSPNFVQLQGWFPTIFTGYEGSEQFQAQLQEIVCTGLTGSALGNCLTTVAQNINDSQVDQLQKKRQATNINLTNTNFSPNIAVAWQPWSNGKTAFKASAGRYYNNIPLTIPLRELNPAFTSVIYRADLTDPDLCDEEDDACGKTSLESGVSPLISVLTVDRDLKTPYQDEFTFKIERELWAETSLNFTYINRKFRDQIQDININLRPGDLGFCQRELLGSNKPALMPSPGVSAKSCIDLDASSGTPLPVECSIDADCADYGGVCDWIYSIAGDFAWIANDYGDPYPDTVPGVGDGYYDPVTDSTFDNCIGENTVGTPPGAEGGVSSVHNFQFLRSPDKVTDLYLQNPFWADLFLIGNFNSADYEALVLEIVRRQYRSWEMNGSYTYSESKGDGEDFFQSLGDDPTLRDNVRGFQSYDQTHVVKMNATTVTPWGIRLGTSVTWQSGLPYSLLTQDFSTDTLPPSTISIGGQGSRQRQTYPTGVRNDQRNDSFWNLDLKATKELRLGKSMNLQLSAEVFNLFDDDTFQVYNPFLQRGVNVNGIDEGRQRFGRSWQMGMRLSF